MHRQQLLRLLVNYKPIDPTELTFKQRMIDFVQAYPDCFERSLALGHMTASAWLLNQDRTQALVMLHTKLDKWVQVGGHCDGDSDVLAVAIKEAQEESGIQNIVPISPEIFDIDIHLIPSNPRESAHFHYDVRFLLGVVGDQQFVQNRESKELRWISKHRAELLTDNTSVTRMFDKWCQLA